MMGASRSYRFAVAASLAVLLTVWTAGAGGQEPKSSTRVGGADVAAGADKKKDDAKTSLTVAVLDFSAETPEAAPLGKQISEIVSASLGEVDGFKVVDRSTLAEALKELELNLTGLVRPDQATKVGHQVGAQLLVTGKAFALDDQLFITARIIGTETTLVEGVLVKGEKGDTVAKLTTQLVEKLTAKLREKGPGLVAADGPAAPDPVPALAKRLAALRKPVVAVHISERHLADRPAAGAGTDPAVETEVKKVLRDAGFKVVEGGEREQAEAGVEVIVGGEAFSELAARIGNLVSCSARVELKVTERKGGILLHADRETTRAVHLSEGIAGKNALQLAGHTLGVRLLQHFADTLKSSDAPADAAPREKK